MCISLCVAYKNQLDCDNLGYVIQDHQEKVSTPWLVLDKYNDLSLQHTICQTFQTVAHSAGG